MKIYTYTNPFKINEETYWDEIRNIPHLCVSQTLVQGLKRHYGRASFQYISTIDKIINEVYSDWYQNIERKIQQFISVSNSINNISDDVLKSSMKFNQKMIVDALRFIIELRITPRDFNKLSMSSEQKMFINIAKSVINQSCWNYKTNYDSIHEGLACSIKKCFTDEVNQELDDIISTNSLTLYSENLLEKLYICLEFLDEKNDDAYIRQTETLHHYTSLLIKPEYSQVRKVVFHGVHQFTPRILSLLKELENSNIEVIFLINYQKKYSHMYDTWKKVYKWTGCDFHPSRDIDDFDCRIVGESIGNILQGKRSGDIRLDHTITKYHNRTEFSDYVANCFSNAGKLSKYPSHALSNMTEQFYGVSCETINDILKFYFPEQFEDKHFLSFPIGQFILSIYNMWDGSSNLNITDSLLKECLALNIWGFHGTTTPISIYEKIKGYIEDLNTISEVIDRLNYLLHVKKEYVSQSDNSILKEFPFFNASDYDIKYLISILIDISKIAEELFASQDVNSIDFKKHFRKLVAVISMKMDRSRSVSEQEKQLVYEVKERLASLNDSETIIGDINDLRQTLHYYLNTEVQNSNANWIVRNFEQIDGGVLLSPYTKAKKYHYCLLSDRCMKQANEDFFPWPLTLEMLEKCNCDSTDVNTILVSYKEYRNFLRFSLFYGTYYLWADKSIQFSYIEDNGTELDIPYYILSLIGLETKNYELTRKQYEVERFAGNRDASYGIDLVIANLSQEEKEIFTSCPYRYLLNFAIDCSSCFGDAFDSRRLYSLLLFSEVWRKNVGLPKEDIYDIMVEESKSLRKLFPFWRAVDFVDLENTAYYYLTYRGMINHGRLQRYHSDYVRRKVAFKDSRRISTTTQEYSDDYFIEYLNNTANKEPVGAPYEQTEGLCRSCNQRSICLKNRLDEGIR